MADLRILATGNFLRLVADGPWEFVQRTTGRTAVGIVAVTPFNKLILVEQYRPPMGTKAIELPAGLIGDIAGQENESITLAAQRELLEETGYEAGSMEVVTGGPNSPGMSDEVVYLVVAKKLKKVAAGGGDVTESIVVHEVPVEEVHPWLEKRRAMGMVIDPKIYAGLFFVGPR